MFECTAPTGGGTCAYMFVAWGVRSPRRREGKPHVEGNIVQELLDVDPLATSHQLHPLMGKTAFKVEEPLAYTGSGRARVVDAQSRPVGCEQLSGRAAGGPHGRPVAPAVEGTP